MGRKSFEGMAPYWPTATGPFAALMNEIPKALFTIKGFKSIDSVHTTTAEQLRAATSWAEARVIDGDLAGGIRKLKSEPGKPIVAIGGAGFMRSLMVTGLIDEYVLAIHPVALGLGLPIFRDLAIPLYLNLMDVKTFPKGIVVHHYSI
jgi:dihydrofolate reductase